MFSLFSYVFFGFSNWHLSAKKYKSGKKGIRKTRKTQKTKRPMVFHYGYRISTAKV